MIAVMQGITVDRVVLVVFIAGTLYERLKQTRTSLRDQGKRIGELATRLAALEAKVGAA
jgi:hypothetical protein